MILNINWCIEAVEFYTMKNWPAIKTYLMWAMWPIGLFIQEIPPIFHLEHGVQCYFFRYSPKLLTLKFINSNMSINLVNFTVFVLFSFFSFNLELLNKRPLSICYYFLNWHFFLCIWKSFTYIRVSCLTTCHMNERWYDSTK